MTETAQRHRRAVLLMLASAAFFVANVLLVRALGTLGSANVWLISVARFVVGLALVMTVYRRDFEPTHLWRNRKLIDRGLVGGVGVYLTYLTVIELGAGRATFIGNTYVIWGAFMAAWILKEKLHASVITGGVAALAGLALLTNVFSTARPPGLYDALAVVASLLSAHVVVTIRQLHGREHTSTIFAAQCAYGLLICTVPAIHTFEPLTLPAWGVLIVASLCAGGGQLTMTRAFRDLPVAEGSLIQMIVPLGIAVGGFAFFGEHFAPHELLGAALILAATAFVALRRDAKPTPPENE
jgi:drug/metabolite transporter (DMT)-like permease